MSRERISRLMNAIGFGILCGVTFAVACALVVNLWQHSGALVGGLGAALLFAFTLIAGSWWVE